MQKYRVQETYDISLTRENNLLREQLNSLSKVLKKQNEQLLFLKQKQDLSIKVAKEEWEKETVY
jgi:hypothetical protein